MSMSNVIICVCHSKSVQCNLNIVLVLNVLSNLPSFKYICFNFFTYLIELDGLLVAKSSYYDELLVAKSSNMLSVTKSRTVELSVAKDHVRCYLLIAPPLVATTGSVAKRFSN